MPVVVSGQGTASRGINVRATGSSILIDTRFFSSSTGSVFTTGTATAQLFQLMSDGSVLAYDFSTSTFIANSGNPVTPTIALASQGTGTGPTASGLWTAIMTPITGFTSGATYYIVINSPAGCVPGDCVKFQYAGADGDLSLDASGRTTDVNSVDTHAKALAVYNAVSLSQINGIIAAGPTTISLTVNTLTVAGNAFTPPIGNLAGLQCVVQDASTGAEKARLTILGDAGTTIRTFTFAAPGFAVAPNASDTVSIS